mmetsp:Transcript_10152/g.23482  ORF Transcript_10152/g.23482 Transcript_10152/m.23482 type:complete len:237 (+) Transcript_10152:414-1124(+)
MPSALSSLSEPPSRPASGSAQSFAAFWVCASAPSSVRLAPCATLTLTPTESALSASAALLPPDVEEDAAWPLLGLPLVVAETDSLTLLLAASSISSYSSSSNRGGGGAESVTSPRRALSSAFLRLRSSAFASHSRSFASEFTCRSRRPLRSLHASKLVVFTPPLPAVRSMAPKPPFPPKSRSAVRTGKRSTPLAESSVASCSSVVPHRSRSSAEGTPDLRAASSLSAATDALAGNV